MGWTKLLLYLFMLRMSTAHMSRCAQVLTVGLSVPTKMPLSVEGFYPLIYSLWFLEAQTRRGSYSEILVM